MAQFTTFGYKRHVIDYGHHNVLYVDPCIDCIDSSICKYIIDNYKDLNRVFQRESLNLVLPPVVTICVGKKVMDILGGSFAFKTDCLEAYRTILPRELLETISLPTLVWWNEIDQQFELVILDDEPEHIPSVFAQAATHINCCYEECYVEEAFDRNGGELHHSKCNCAPAYRACEEALYDPSKEEDKDRFFYLLADLFKNENERELFLEDEKMKKEVRRLKNAMKVLEAQGFGPDLIINLLKKSEDKYPKLIIRDYRIYLEGLPEKEIDLGPRELAFYLLYLKHTEGINYKDMVDYQNELTDLYRHTSHRTNEDMVRRPISTLIDPTKNDMSITCNKIKKAFCSMLNTWVADAYYIKGEQGENKYISLDRNLVVWE